MSDTISGINSSSNNFNNVTINTREIPKEDLEAIAKYLSGTSEDGFSITTDEIKVPENKSFLSKLFDKVTGKADKPKEIPAEELAAMIDIGQMSGLD